MDPAAVLLTCISLTAVDGDTVKCDGQNMRLLGDGAPYESGVDTPEVGRWADCLAEDKSGRLAKHRVTQLLDQEGILIEDSGEIDRWGRPLVSIRLPNDKSLGGTLIEEGYATQWYPGYKDDWCQD